MKRLSLYQTKPELDQNYTRITPGYLFCYLYFLCNGCTMWGELHNKQEVKMTKQQEIQELEQRLGREIAIEYFKNEKRVVSEEQAELEDYTNFSFEENTKESIIL